jgi:alkanesulfonate monooxygenase SsuD/methylene tetrahydromethanopterin reductase-like flavin-dependent oxidoreductase (luciferase family)
VQFSLFLPQMRFAMDAITERARAAEAAGFGGLALMDHLAPPMAESQPMFDAMTTAAWVAAATSTLHVGHLVLCDAMRHPAVLAKQAVTLDHASGGRFELGIGWGSVQAELERFGVNDTSPRQRVGRFAETLDVLTALWSGEVVDYDGEFHTLRGAQQAPTPTGRIPIVIGGTGPATMRLVARHADWWNIPLSSLDRLDDLRPAAGDARVSVQQMIAFVPDESVRQEITDTATRRFGVYGDGLVVGTAPELVDHFHALADRGVERVYSWFADFAPPATLAAFGHAVVEPLEGAST